MEPCRSPETSQNCFLPARSRRKMISAEGNEVYLYDEAEPLMYVCSKTSMPPQSAGNVRAHHTAGVSAAGKDSSSKVSCRKSRTSSTLVYDTGERQTCKASGSPRSAEERTFTKGRISDFKSQILDKIQQFGIRPESRCSNNEEHGVTDAEGYSREHKSTHQSQDIEEIFTRNTKFFTSSSESERVRISSEEMQDDVFSTGISDEEDGVGPADVEPKSDERQRSRETNEQPLGNANALPQWFATKSIIKNANMNIRSPTAHTSPIRTGAPVQGKLSLRNMKTTPPCFCLLDEIKKNNLVMREDIISSSSHKVLEAPTNQAQTGGSSTNDRNNGKGMIRGRSKDTEATNNQISKKQRNCSPSTSTRNDTQLTITVEADEVYETGEGTARTTGNAEQKQSPDVGQDPVMPDVNALAVNLHYGRHCSEEFWRPFNSPHQNGEERSNEKTIIQITEGKPNTSSTLQHSDHRSVRIPNIDDQTNIQMSEYVPARPSAPNRRLERYVKLPGLAEAVFQQDSNFKGITIKDGMSFESVNALKEMSIAKTANPKDKQEHRDMRMHNIANQIQQILDSNEVNSRNIGNKGIVQKNTPTETKDAATDFRVPLTNTITQTRNCELVDCSVQCESFIIDEADERNVVKSDHQEIMVCNENGDGVQLYNELGHPLTDMDGYLLKDSHGRFLVRLDRFGIPVSCTNGQKIFMEDSTAWDKGKNNVSIVHQSRKRPIKRGHRKKGKARPSLDQLDAAMSSLKNTLGLASNISLDTSHGNILERLPYFDLWDRGPSRRIKPTLDATKLNNATSLIAEMKSIARLRNALLEKVNFIADNKNKIGRFGTKKKKTLGEKSPEVPDFDMNRSNGTTSIWKGQPRPFSPTYQAVKNLKESGTTNGSDWLNFGEVTTKIRSQEDFRTNPVDDMRIGCDSENEMKTMWSQRKTDTWINNALPGSGLKARFSADESDGNELKTDLWSFINEESNTSRVETNTIDDFLIPQTNLALEKDWKTFNGSDTRIVSVTENLPGVSGITHATDSAFPGSQLLFSLEKQYNLRGGNDWIETWKAAEKPSISRNLERNSIDPTEKAGRRSEMRASIEYSSCSSNNF